AGTPPPHSPTPSPYTTLFRSGAGTVVINSAANFADGAALSAAQLTIAGTLTLNGATIPNNTIFPNVLFQGGTRDGTRPWNITNLARKSTRLNSTHVATTNAAF